MKVDETGWLVGARQGTGLEAVPTVRAYGLAGRRLASCGTPRVAPGGLDTPRRWPATFRPSAAASIGRRRGTS